MAYVSSAAGEAITFVAEPIKFKLVATEPGRWLSQQGTVLGCLLRWHARQHDA
jgi:hypothetical protein